MFISSTCWLTKGKMTVYWTGGGEGESLERECGVIRGNEWGGRWGGNTREGQTGRVHGGAAGVRWTG